MKAFFAGLGLALVDMLWGATVCALVTAVMRWMRG